MISIFKLAYRNFLRNIPRYRLLIITMSIAVAAMVIVFSLLMGITRSVEEKALRYFAGDIAVQQYAVGIGRSVIDNPYELMELIRSEAPADTQVFLRSVYYESNASIFFNGTYANQRRLIGVDWSAEHEHLSRMSISQGYIPEETDPRAIIISSSTAERLGSRVGDDVIVSLRTVYGQINTMALTVRAIFDESSFFGYAAYMERSVLNNGVSVQSDEVNELGILYSSGRSPISTLSLLSQYSEDSGLEFVIAETRDQRSEIMRTLSQDSVIALTMNAQLAEINELLNAISIIAMFVLLLFLAILIIGVSNTYSMVVYERTSEIGALRAMGLTQKNTVFLFLAEAMFLSVTSLLIGLFFGVMILVSLHSLIYIDQIEFMTLFLERGRLPVHLPLQWIIIMSAASILSGVLGAFRPAMSAGKLAPVDAMRQE